MTQALLDSGAAVSLLTESLFKKIKEKGIKINYVSRHVKLLTVDGSTIPFNKTIQISFKLGEKQMKNVFFVANNNFSNQYQMILGYDFFKNQNAILDCQEGTLKLGQSQPIKMSQLKDENKNNSRRQIRNKHEDVYTVSLIRKISLKPFESKIIELRCDKKINDNETVFITPIHNKVGININEGLLQSTQNNTVFCMISNNSNKHIHLNKKMKMGTLSTDIKNNTETATRDIALINHLSAEEITRLRKEELTANDFDLTHIDDSNKNDILKLLLDNFNAFSKSYQTLGETSVVTPIFKLSHNFPIQAKAYPIPAQVKDYAKGEIMQLLKAGIIRESTANYASPVIWIKKKNNNMSKNSGQNNYRLACDYRLLNQITELFPFKLPNINDILHRISGHKLYTVLDLKSAFFQIKLREQDQDILTFTTEFGNFAPLRLPFGCKNSSSYYSLLMQKLLEPLHNLGIEHYLDDIIIAANSIAEMHHKVKALLDRIQTFNLTLDPHKLQLYKPEIEYLGFKINEHGFAPSDKNVKKILSFPKPANQKQMKSLLGLTGFFRGNIDKYSDLVNPLIEITKQKKFSWNENAEKAFKDLQDAILKQPSLHPVDNNAPFFLTTDASKVAISAILLQKKDNNFVPIEFYSRKLKETESKYPSFKSELLAIHDSILHFSNYLYGRHFKILSDAKSLTYYIGLTKQPDIIARWLLDIQQYDFQINHIPGTQNPADFLSRVIANVASKEFDVLFEINPLLKLQNIKNEQNNDEETKKFIHRIKNNETTKKDKLYFIDNEGILRRFIKKGHLHPIVAPKSLIKAIIYEGHKSHFAAKKTTDIIKKFYFWNGMQQDIYNWCARCTRCNLFKPRNLHRNPINFIQPEHSPGTEISIDVLGPLPRSTSGNKYILTIIDDYTRHLEICPMNSIHTHKIINALIQYFARFGIPKYLKSDNGAQLKSREFRDFTQGLGIIHKFTSIYKPTSNAKCERSHKTIKHSLAAMAENDFNWENKALFFKLQYNCTTHRATNHSPALLFFGRDLNLPLNQQLPQKSEINTAKYIQQILRNAKKMKDDVIQQEKKIMKEYEKLNINRSQKKFSPGDTVYMKELKNKGSFRQKFNGPYTIIEVKNKQNYIIRDKYHPHLPTIKIHAEKLFSIPKMRENIADINNNQNSQKETLTRNLRSREIIL